MTTSTTQGRALAIAAGCAFTAGGLTILLGDALLRPAEWTTYHVLTVLTVFGTIAAGHLMADAGRAGHTMAAAGFLVLFLAGTALVVYQSVGRQAEVTDTKASTAEATNTALAEKHADLRDARARLRHAHKKADEEMTGERCGQRCKDWRTNAKDITSTITRIEAEIAAIGPQKPVAPKAEKMAAVAALFGANEAKAKAALMLLEPFLLTLFFELGSVISLGYVFGHRPAGRSADRPADLLAPSVAHQQPAHTPSEADRQQTSFGGDAPLAYFMGEQPDNGSSGGSSGPDKPHRPAPKGPPSAPDGRKDEVLAALLTDLALGRTFGTQRELQGRYGVERSTMSDWLREWEGAGLIPARRTVGRRKELARMLVGI